jgi:hypothetical protein
MSHRRLSKLRNDRPFRHLPPGNDYQKSKSLPGAAAPELLGSNPAYCGFACFLFLQVSFVFFAAEVCLQTAASFATSEVGTESATITPSLHP